MPDDSAARERSEFGGRAAFGRRALSNACLALFALAPALAGCGEEGERRRPGTVSAEVSEDVGTVVSVSWSTDEPSVGYVAYGTTEDLELATPLEEEPAREHHVNLLGLHSDTVYYYRVVTWDGDDAAASEIESLRTGGLPTGLPSFTVEGDGHDRYTVLPVFGITTSVTIVDPSGEIVWYHRDDRDLDVYRARLSLDGTSVLYNAASVSGDPSDQSELVRVSLDGSTESSISIPLLAHDFVELPDGTLAAIVVEYRDFEGTQLRGDKIVEVAPDGTQSTVWSAWDCFDPAESPGDNIELGWTFANALDYDPVQDAYYLGMRNFSSITKIDRQSGTCEWVLGLTASTLDFAEGSDRFLHQHQFEIRSGNLLVMDNDGASGDVSRVLEYELDLEAGVATQVWSYEPDPAPYSFVLGEPSRLTDGSTFINWGAAGQLERVSEEGEQLWKLNVRAGFVFGFHTLASSLYQ